MSNCLARRIFVLPWLTIPPIGFEDLSKGVCKSEPTLAALG